MSTRSGRLGRGSRDGAGFGEVDSGGNFPSGFGDASTPDNPDTPEEAPASPQLIVRHRNLPKSGPAKSAEEEAPSKPVVVKARRVSPVAGRIARIAERVRETDPDELGVAGHEIAGEAADGPDVPWDDPAVAKEQEDKIGKARKMRRALTRYRAITVKDKDDDGDDDDTAFAEQQRVTIREPLESGAIPDALNLRYRHLVATNPRYVREFVLDHVELLLLRGAPKDAIAAQFGVNVKTVYRWRKVLGERNVRKFRDLQRNDVAVVIGKDIAFFETRMTLGMQMATKQGASVAAVRAGLEIAERAHTNLITYRDKLGYYDKKVVTPRITDETDTHAEDARLISDAANEIMGEVLDGLIALDDGAMKVVG